MISLDEEVEKSLQLGAVPSQRGREGHRVDLGGLERPDVELEPVAELLDPAEHPHRVALGEAAVEELDVVPDPRVDPPARVDQLDREVRRSALRAQPALRLHREHALDDTVGFEVGDHPAESIGCFGSLRPCPRSTRFPRSATTRTSPGHSRTSSRRPTT